MVWSIYGDKANKLSTLHKTGPITHLLYSPLANFAGSLRVLPTIEHDQISLHWLQAVLMYAVVGDVVPQKAGQTS